MSTDEYANVSPVSLALAIMLMPAQWGIRKFRNYYSRSDLQCILIILCARAHTEGCLAEALKLLSLAVDEVGAVSVITRYVGVADKASIEMMQAYCLQIQNPNLQWLLFCAIGRASDMRFHASFVSRASLDAFDELKVRGFAILASAQPDDSLVRSMLSIAEKSTDERIRFQLLREVCRAAKPSFKDQLVGFIERIPSDCWEKAAAMFELHRLAGGLEAKVIESLEKLENPFHRALAFAYCRSLRSDWSDEVVKLSKTVSLAGEHTLDVLDYLSLRASLDCPPTSRVQASSALKQMLRQVTQLPEAFRLRPMAALCKLYPERSRAIVRLVLRARINRTLTGMAILGSIADILAETHQYQGAEAVLIARLALVPEEWALGSRARLSIGEMPNIEDRIFLALAADAVERSHTASEILDVVSSTSELLKAFAYLVAESASNISIEVCGPNCEVPLIAHYSPTQPEEMIAGFSEWREAVRELGELRRSEVLNKWGRVAHLSGAVAGDDLVVDLGAVVLDTCKLIP